ncbi:MAG: glycosyltransferase, partial [Rickettsiales bacterium]|nr:glycosyltransferase [Rickettsiales bacterium]
LDKLQKKYIFKYYSEKDKGIDDAYNKAFTKVNGDIIYYLNSDDYLYDDNVFSDIVSIFKENPTIDYCYGLEQRISRDGILRDTVEHDNKSLFFFNVPYSHQSFFIKKKVMTNYQYTNLVKENYNSYKTIQRNGGRGRIKKYTYGGDYNLMINLILDDKMGFFIKRYICYYREGGKSNNIYDIKKTIEVSYCIANVIYNFSKLFSDSITIYECQKIYTEHIFPILYTQKLIKFIVDLNLKHFDYTAFLHVIHSLEIRGPKFEYRYYKLFNFIPILKVKTNAKGNKVYYKLFGFIPLFVKKVKL